jgi:DNA mismatch repair protein MutS2
MANISNLIENNIDSASELRNESLRQLEFKNVLEKIKNYCYSDLGIDEIRSSMPVDDIDWLQREHSFIDEMKELLIEDDQLPFEGLSDIRAFVSNSIVENAMLSPVDVLSVGDMLRVFRLIRQYFIQRTENYDNLRSLSENLFENKLLEKHIIDTVDETGAIKDTATRELSTIRARIKDKSAKLRTRLQRILKKVSEEAVVQEDFYSMREGRFVLPVKVENKSKLPGIIHGMSQTGATVFVEPAEIIDMNNELSLLHGEEEREMRKILMNLTAEIGADAIQINSSIDIMAHIDTIYAKARYAIDFGGIKPIISDDEPYIKLKNVKHPLLMHSKGKDNVIPLTISFDSSKRGHLISGPNAGGKTVALKSVGLNITMALSGIFPLGECSTDYRTVFTAIGDQQSIENDLSTFSSQMTQLKNIIDHSDKNSLVLVDEIGSGTDPQEGAALAAGILDTFINTQLFFIATTHQSSLKTYALNREEIENASLEFDEEKFVPTYKFLQGTPGNSYAFFLAKNIGLNELVIKRSKKYLGSKEKELEASISILQKYRYEAVKTRVEAEQEKLKYQKLYDNYEVKIDKFNEKRESMIDNAKKEAAEIVSNANALIEKAIKEVQEKEKSFAEIKKDFSQEKEKIEKAAKKSSEERIEKTRSIDINVGDPVKMSGNENTGVVLQIFDESKEALVEFNGLKFKVKINKLEKTKKEKEKKRDTSDYISFDINSRIDLRGDRAEEALQKLDEFISNAILSDLNEVNIIHGKGTGALRESVHQYLKHHPSVKNYRLGEITEGGSGMTVAMF